MIISIFGGAVLKPGMEAEEARAIERLDPILRAMPGFIAYDDFQGSDGSAIAIARFTTRAAMRAWVRQPDHLEVQRMVGDLYESMWVQTAETFSEAVLDQGRRRDGDLAHLFVG